MNEKELNSTVPSFATLKIQLNAEENVSKEIASHVSTLLMEIGKFIDLSSLDGLTIASAYEAALAGVDRGVQTNGVPKASNDLAVGVAMTLLVLRGDEVRSQVVLNGGVMLWFLDNYDSENYQSALHILAHECAHVEANGVFDRQFPGYLLRKRYDSLYDQYRQVAAHAAWDEFVATMKSCKFGEDQTEHYAQILMSLLEKTEGGFHLLKEEFNLSNKNIESTERLVSEINSIASCLMKFSSYFLGNEFGFGRDYRNSLVLDKIGSHWFGESFHRLASILEDIANSYGKWESFDDFERLSGIWDGVMKSQGVEMVPHEDGRMQIFVT